MPASISGVIFNDLNHNGVFDVGEPVIANAFVVLEGPTAGTCVTVQTNASGQYTFTNINTAGTYTVYDTISNAGATCPPTTFTLPTGFTGTTTARKLSVTVTATNITNNTDITGNNFGFDNLTSFGCQSFAYMLGIPGGVNPPTSQLIRLDLKTGSAVNLGRVNQPSTATLALNGFGYNATDGNFYGWNPNTNSVFRLTQDLNIVNYTIPNLPITTYTVGDVSAQGYYYFYASSTSFFVVDVNPNRSTYMKLVNPAAGFAEQTTAPFGVTISSVLSVGDWSFNPQDGQLYTVGFGTGGATPGIISRINPTTGAVTNLTTSPVVTGNYGGTFFDNYNNLYATDNNTLQVSQYALTSTTATRTPYSTTGFTTNDGARCPTAPISFASLSGTKSATPYVGVGDTISYTILVNNNGNQTANNVTLIDTIPNGTIFTTNNVTVNGTPVVGNPSPPTGINLGDLPVGISTITFVVNTTTVPTPNPTPNTAASTYTYTDGTLPGTFNSNFSTNTASTTVTFAQLNMTKGVDKGFANIGDVLNYTITLTNVGNTSAQSILFIDTIPNGTSYSAGTFKQDNANVSGTPNPPGATLPNVIPAGGVSTITFSVVVNTFPNPNPIPNDAATSYSSIGNPTIPTNQTNTSGSNTVTTTVNNATLGGITKTVDRAYADCGDTITYTITIPNGGNVTATNVVFKDTIPNGTTLVPDSVYVNGTQQQGANPATGISVGAIGPSGTASVTFSVIVQC